MSSISGSSSSGLNFTGLATGIDTEKIITGLTALSQRRIDKFTSKQASETAKQTIFSTLKGKLTDLQTSVGTLARSIGGAFEGRKVTSSDDTSVTGVGSSSALAGTYNITVNQLAQANQIASSAVTDQSTNIKTGTVSIKVGSGSPVNVTVDSTNNTLQGLAASINEAAGDVKASVVGDSGGYRLLLTSTKTGAANAISVTSNLTGGTGATVDLTERQVQAAQDSQVKLGTGPGAITVNSATNRADNLITGVSLTLTKADPAKSIAINIAADNEAASKSIDEFVKAYNDVLDFIDARDDYDSQTRSSGVFLGNRDVADLKNDLATAVGSVVGGTNPKLNRMSAVGLSFDDKGKLAFDSSKLSKVMNGEVEGVSAADVKRLFSMAGTSTNGSVNFLFGGSKTKPSPSGQPYQVNVTSVATRASITGGSALGGSVTISGTNNSFSIRVNNLSTAVVTIDSGSYTPAMLASAIQAQLNGRFGNGTVSVDLNSDRLRFSSGLYGSSSRVELAGGNAAATLGFAGTEAGVGTNVAGSYIVDGKTETASGSGQVLTGSGDNANTAGLQVRVGLTDDQLNSGGAEASLTVTQGLASRLSQTLDRYTDSINGRFKTIDDRFKRSVDTIQSTITRENTQMESRKNALLLQFSGVESSVSQLKNIGSQISASFSVLSFR